MHSRLYPFQRAFPYIILKIAIKARGSPSICCFYSSHITEPRFPSSSVIIDIKADQLTTYLDLNQAKVENGPQSLLDI